MNLYATLGALKASLSLTGTARDGVYLSHLEGASRRIENHCGRVFFVSQGVRYFNADRGVLVYLDDFCSLSALAMDSELDGTFDGETWVEGVDWVAMPYNSFPKFGVELHVDGNYCFQKSRRYIKATGLFGYGDGLRAAPWDATTVTATVATEAGTALTLSADDVVSPGHTLVIGAEQLYVESVAAGLATVRRGVNGTTAAVHSGATVNLVRYPKAVEQACVTLAISSASRELSGGKMMERIGEYSYQLASEGQEGDFMVRALAGLTRI